MIKDGPRRYQSGVVGSLHGLLSPSSWLCSPARVLPPFFCMSTRVRPARSVYLPRCELSGRAFDTDRIFLSFPDTPGVLSCGRNVTLLPGFLQKLLLFSGSLCGVCGLVQFLIGTKTWTVSLETLCSCVNEGGLARAHLAQLFACSCTIDPGLFSSLFVSSWHYTVVWR